MSKLTVMVEKVGGGYEASLIVADVLEALEAVETVWSETVATHYAGCWMRHAQCLAVHVRSLIEDGEDK